MMSGTSRQPGAGSLFPPIEVGSFVSHRQDKSEFIGSASGIFFINTVFRAFAGASAYGTELTGAARGAATPESVHGFLTAIDSNQEPAGNEDALLELINSPAEPDSDCTSGYSYGINIPGLGNPPSPAAAKKLLMVYFQKWHPFYPFLHGPTFFNKVDQFYDTLSPEVQGTRSRESLRDKLCRAVCFQCIFNIAAINVGNPQLLPPQSRITSPDLLTGLIGILAGGQDVEALQVLLAVELYLITRMASRAASTVHGTLTRVLYQAGLHRCPFRYVQLPNDMRAIRQRIWWCTYVLDRYLSQALGHPLSISDEEVDVCIPGMPELHNPVRTCHPASTVTDGAEIRAHLPMNHESFMRDNGVTDTAATASSDTTDSQSPAHHYKRRPEDAGSLVLGYTVTYTQIFGAALRLFHSSIHKRSITLDNVLDITSRVHSWWNSLPASLQDEDTTGSKSSYGPYFAVLYHHLIIFINRPFLSLPIHREDFRSSLQSALNSSRTIIRQLQTGPKDSLLLAWPGALASIWMSSLVVAYATLLKIYPLEKGLVDLNNSLSILEKMGNSWSSASHCHDIIKSMAGQLTSRNFMPRTNSSQELSIPHDEVTDNEGTNSESFPASADEDRTKRRRQNPYAAPQAPSRSSAAPVPNNPPNPFYPEIWQPVLEYTGPDLGFDTYQFGRQDAWQEFLAQGLNPGLSGLLFDNAGWDSYVKTFGDRLN